MNKETLRGAQRMQQHILCHCMEPLTPGDVARAAGYSERHGGRIFKECTGRSISEYIRLLRLSAAAESLIQEEENILNVALSHQYNSHEGFLKAFSSAFGISPKAYRKGDRPIQYFIPYPLELPPTIFERRNMPMEMITVTICPRPARKLLLHYSQTGTDYWSFCQEKGCDWEGLLLSIKGRMDTPAFLSLPESMIPAGCSSGAAGIELPLDYSGALPSNYALTTLPAGSVAYFQSPPFESEDEFPLAIQAVFSAYEQYDPTLYGYAFDTESLPLFNFGASAATGARIGVPLRELAASE